MARADGERYLTDLRHVTQALHEAATTEGLGTAALTAWLRTRIAEVGSVFTDERTRRLETDAAAVQVVTVHAAKGLEFGVVYVPFGWERFEPDDQELFAFHDDHGQRVLHLGGVGSPGSWTPRGAGATRSWARTCACCTWRSPGRGTRSSCTGRPPSAARDQDRSRASCSPTACSAASPGATRGPTRCATTPSGPRSRPSRRGRAGRSSSSRSTPGRRASAGRPVPGRARTSRSRPPSTSRTATGGAPRTRR